MKKNPNTQVRRHGGKKSVSPQVLSKTKSIVRARPTVDEMRNGRLPARNVVKPVRGVPDAQLAAVSSALGLSAEESRALKLISEWEGLSPVELCNLGFAGYMESSFGDLQGFALGQSGGRPKEQTWARKFYSAVKNCFTEDGDLKEFEPTPAVADGDNAFEAEALRFIAETNGRLPVDELEGMASDLEYQALQARAAARAVTRDPAAWDRADAINTTSDGSPALKNGERATIDKRGKRSSEVNGGKAGAR